MEPSVPGECPHFQPDDLTALAEAQLRAAGIPEVAWEGRRFHWGGAIDAPPFNALVVQCLRRQNQWVITKLDRRKDGVPAKDTGFREL